MTQPDFRLLGGRACLDLVATLGKRHTEPVERLPDPPTLLSWLVAARVLPADAIATADPAQLDALRALRETVNRLVRARMAGTAFDPADVAALNALAARPDLAPQLGARPVSWGDQNPVDRALASIARDAVDLLSGPRADRIKECAHPDCSLLFLDDSQSGRRRWCSMERCGNLVKIAGYRSRARA